MYGAQTIADVAKYNYVFENDVEMYGAQTDLVIQNFTTQFENDVEMYGAQTLVVHSCLTSCLRMM